MSRKDTNLSECVLNAFINYHQRRPLRFSDPLRFLYRKTYISSVIDEFYLRIAKLEGDHQ